MSLLERVAKLGLRSWLGKAFLVFVSLTVLSFGSVAEVPFNLATVAFAVLGLISVYHPIGTVAVGRVQTLTIVLLATLLVYVVVQTLPIAAGNLVNPAWKSVNELVGPVEGTISVAPGMTREAITALALPFLVFLGALAFFQTDDEALLLWRGLAYFGVGYAAFGILQELFLPEWLLFEAKRFYVGYLTASFVNRNSAGTFFGIALVLNIGLVFYYLRKIRLSTFTEKVLYLDIGWRDGNAQVLLHGLFSLIVAVALFLTQSRGAVGATFVAAVLAVVLMSRRRITADKPSEAAPPRWRRHAALTGGVLVIVGLFALFAGRSVYRMAEQGTEDGRWCSFASTIEAIRDNPIVGTGFGTFMDVFPAYRNADCAGIFGIWDKAHNFFLEGYLGLGLPFAVALLIGYAVLIGAFLRGMRNRREFRFVPVMGMAVLVLVSLHSIVDFSLQIPGVGVYFAAATAAAVTISLGRGWA